MLSTTVTTCVAVAVLPEASVTVQVTVVSPTGKLAGASLVVVATLQLSEVVGVPRVTFVAEQLAASILTLIATGAVILGSMLSTTVTICVAVAVFPLASVTVQVTVVSPTGKLVGASLVVVAKVQLSAVVGFPRVTFVASQLSASTLTLIATGAVILGSMLSITVTICVAVAVFPEPSVTVQVTLVSPTGKLVGASLVVVATVQLSAVVGFPRVTLVASQLSVSTLTLIASGAVMVGLIVSASKPPSVILHDLFIKRVLAAWLAQL